MVELRGVSKYFPSNGVIALANANFTLRPGEIHSLLGENGSGKSTLMHILAGYFPASSGIILVDGKKLNFSAPAKALAYGIGMVRQHPGFIKGFKVWEDCILGSEMQGRFFFDPLSLRKRVEEKAALWHFELPLDAEAESLTVGQRQKAAILSLLLKNVKWFIFDEPTTALSPEETQTLFGLYARLRSEGRGIVFITHKVEEAQAISDRVTEIKHGVTDTKQHFPKNIKPQGNYEIPIKTPFHVENVSSVAPVVNNLQVNENSARLVIKDLCLEMPGLPALSNVNLRLMGGSLLGITGDRNSGLETLELAVTGLLNQGGQSQGFIRQEGAIILNGLDITCKGVKAFRHAGGAYLGADRLGNNFAPALPIFESLVIHAFRRARFGIFLKMGSLNSWCREIMGRAGITRSLADRASSFSGGMLQRILLARELTENASLLVLTEAGSCLDQISRLRLAEELKKYVLQGASVLLFSADVDELLPFTGKIMVLREGTLASDSGDVNEV